MFHKLDGAVAIAACGCGQSPFHPVKYLVSRNIPFFFNVKQSENNDNIDNAYEVKDLRPVNPLEVDDRRDRA